METHDVRTGGTSVRHLRAGDAEAFARFAATMGSGEERFLKEDLSDPDATFASFLQAGARRRLCAVGANGEVQGLAAVVRGEGWSSHVAELRVLVAAPHRGRGVGGALARAALVEALELGCSQVYVEVIAEQDALVAMFQDLGFLPEALLPDFVRDGDGVFHDLMLLTHRVGDVAAAHQYLGVDEGVA